MVPRSMIRYENQPFLYRYPKMLNDSVISMSRGGLGDLVVRTESVVEFPEKLFTLVGNPSENNFLGGHFFILRYMQPQMFLFFMVFHSSSFKNSFD